MRGEERIEGAAPRLWRSILAAAAGNVLEWYDFTVYAYMAPYIAAKFFPGDDRVAGLLAVFLTFGLGFLVRPLGGILIGRFGDVRGRKAALLLTLVLMAVGTAGIGLIPGYDKISGVAPWLLVLCRLVQGFSAGGEWGSSTAFIYEWAPKGRRAFFSSLQQSSVAGGMLLGSAIAALLGTMLSKTQMSDFGWRLPFLLGASIVPVGWYLWHYVEETPVFVSGTTAPVTIGAGAGLAVKAGGIIVIWTVAYYAILTYMPVFTAQYSKLGASAALWSNALSLLVLAVTIPFFGRLADRIGRKPLLLAGAIGFTLLSYPLFLVIVNSDGMLPVVLAQIVFALMTAIYSGSAPAAVTEIFPSASRLLWMSTGYSLTVALFGGFGPYIATWLVKHTGSPLSPVLYISACALLSLAVIARIKETRHDG
ncbi:MAG TPA: MFS transporter [Rhizomicrobium sp.]|jgi:MHS family proline/betaine transporter-like MFS transporter|nr:MFS transporter [Rhizomicrobium sp.]